MSEPQNPNQEYFSGLKTKSEQKAEAVAEASATTAVLEASGISFGTKQEVVKPKVFGKQDQDPIGWPQNLLYVLRDRGVKASDIPHCPTDSSARVALARKAKNGDKVAAGTLNLCLAIVLECMGRTTEERQVVDNQGRPLFIDHNGNLTPLHFSRTVKDINDKPLRHERAMEMRTPWGVRAGVECQSAPGTPMPTAGHYKKLVIEHFDDLFPRLFFRSATLDPNESDPMAARPAEKAEYLKNLEAHASDEDPDRAELLQWLPAFKQKPIPSWNGED